MFVDTHITLLLIVILYFLSPPPTPEEKKDSIQVKINAHKGNPINNIHFINFITMHVRISFSSFFIFLD